MAHQNDRQGSRWAMLFDFDNTVTSFDVLDAIIERFAVDAAWIPLQDAWDAGRIGSKVCLQEQLQSVRVSRPTLARYLATVSLDPDFKRLVALCRRRSVPIAITSDNFSWVVNRVLQHHGVAGIPVYANRLRLIRNQPIPAFPYTRRQCPHGCAHCKQQHVITQQRRGRQVIYIGDGMSDRCPAEAADLVFAKDRLLRYLRDLGRPCVAFEALGDVYRYVKEMER